MDDRQETSLSSLFATAKSKRSNLEAFASATDPLYQENVHSAIEALKECRKLADRISLFSPNELLEDISSNDLQQASELDTHQDTKLTLPYRYLSIDYYQADIILKQTTLDRKHLLRQAQTFHERYIQLLDTYRILSKTNSKLYERYLEDRDNFSLLLSNDAAARRDTKITRFKEEKQLKQKLEHLSHNPTALDQDDSALRDLHLAELELNNHHTFQSLDMIAQELKILASMPPTPPPGPEEQEADYRERNGLREREDYSDRLDPSLSDLYRGGKTGPILNKDGKPLQPFTLLDSRQRLQDGVFRPGHSLPTMTIDEYLDEEKRRGGIPNGDGGGGGGGGVVDEDDMEQADAETMKARDWDEFTEANPKGSGNTMNRG